MKNLSDYTSEARENKIRDTGVFFAFNNSQFKEKAKKGVRYKNLGLGTFCPDENVEAFKEGMDLILREGIAKDLKENGKQMIISRELQNHEAYYTYDTTDTFNALSGYGITAEEVYEVFQQGLQHH